LPSEKDGEGAVGEEAGAGGENPSMEEDPTAEGGEKNTGAGEASAGTEGSDGEGSGDGSGDESEGDGDSKMAMDVEHATVELNEKGECKRDPKFWGPPLKLLDGGAVYIKRLMRPWIRGMTRARAPCPTKSSGPPYSSNPAKSAACFTPARWAQMNHTEAENFLMRLGQLYLRICTRESSTDPAKLAVWQSKALYIQQAALGCFASYKEDLQLRQKQARQKGN
jgi:hypothetical protein